MSLTRKLKKRIITNAAMATEVYYLANERAAQEGIEVNSDNYLNLVLEIAAEKGLPKNFDWTCLQIAPFLMMEA